MLVPTESWCIDPVTVRADQTVLVNTNELINRRNFDPSQLAAVLPCGAAEPVSSSPAIASRGA